MSKYKPVFFDIETTGFDPRIPDWWDGKPAPRVTAVAIGIIHDWEDDGVDRELLTVVNEGGEEYELIEETRRRMRSIEKELDGRGEVPFLVGHNIIQFDVLYWGARAARYRQNGYPITHGWRRLDTMRALELPNKTFPGQQEYADHLGLDYLDELDGSQMPDAFENGNYSDILDHVVDDVETLMEIFLIEREDMVDEFWGHYKGHDRDPIHENKPSFIDSIEIDIDRSNGEVDE